jgi:hypothetical protein
VPTVSRALWAAEEVLAKVVAGNVRIPKTDTYRIS